MLGREPDNQPTMALYAPRKRDAQANRRNETPSTCGMPPSMWPIVDRSQPFEPDGSALDAGSAGESTGVNGADPTGLKYQSP